MEIELLEPASGVAPGQAAVIYAGTRVVGSATIAKTRPPHPRLTGPARATRWCLPG